MSGHQKVEPDPGLALLTLYDTALPEVYGYLLARCGRRALAEDLAAETFLAAVQACRRAPCPDVTTGWLVGIARHKLVDHWRALDVEDRRLRLLEGGADDLDDPWDAELDALVARDVLARQSPQHRAALTLRYLDGLPVAEVAHLLDRTVHATEALLVRARAAFRRSYDRENSDGGSPA
ncbi:MAG: sigma-70 family RNA polymerase sigma factor [Pseudonocardia sp.]|nr:sigma-70 family RNA polymerase sigma factor [Pseudonocardia sp.]